LKEIWEGKEREKDGEIKRMRDVVRKMEDDVIKEN
jgi:hypothetical protein